MRRSGQPSRPSATTCCRFSSLKTFIPAVDHHPHRLVKRPERSPANGRFSGVHQWPVLGVHRGLTLKLRYKQPDGTQSQLVEVALKDAAKAFESADSDFRFAASVASFGMLLRESPYRGQAEYAKVLAWANTSRDADEGGLRAEFVRLAGLARSTTRN